MKANEAIAVGVALAEAAVTGPCPYEVGRERAREAAKTLAALGPFVEAALEHCRLRVGQHTNGGTHLIAQRESDVTLLAAYRALGLDPAPHGGASE